MGVTVDKGVAVVRSQQLVHRRRGDIHDELLLAGILHLAFTPHLAGDALATAEGQAQEQPAQPLQLGDAAKLLVVDILGAEQIAVAEQHPLAVELDDAGIAEQGHARPPGKLPAEQKVAVAVDEVDGHPLLAQREEGIRHLAVERVGIVVANPEFEQIPQHIERIGAGSVLLQEVHQGGCHVGPGVA
ncbi:hypothetical protein D3C79_702850 [compost metagenome]